MGLENGNRKRRSTVKSLPVPWISLQIDPTCRKLEFGKILGCWNFQLRKNYFQKGMGIVFLGKKLGFEDLDSY